MALDYDHLVPMAELADQWNITPNTVSRRLAFLDIKPVRKGNFRFITHEQWQLANSFHRHLLQGKSMEMFQKPEEKQAKHRIPRGLRYSILERDGFACKACGATSCLEIDHIIPKSKGGPTVESNLQTLCADCNRGKGVSIPNAYLGDGVSLKNLEERWSISRNTLKDRAKILGIDLIRVSSTLTVWPHDKIELGDQLHAYLQSHATSHGFYARKKTSQFNIRLDTDLLEKFKACAYSRGVMVGLDQGQSVNRAVRQAMQWYIDELPE